MTRNYDNDKTDLALMAKDIDYIKSSVTKAVDSLLYYNSSLL
jgi:hypothetical protein